MKKNDKSVDSRPRWPVWAIIALGCIVFALPIDVKIKFMLVVPLYILFLATYYKFMYRKKSS